MGLVVPHGPTLSLSHKVVFRGGKMGKYVKFSYITKYKQRKVYEVLPHEAKRFAIMLLERSHIENIGEVYILHNESWKELDYYNDV